MDSQTAVVSENKNTDNKKDGNKMLNVSSKKMVGER